MNVHSGATYPSLSEALSAGESLDDLVEVYGRQEQIEELSENVQRGMLTAAAKENRKIKRRMQKESRKRNR